MNDVRRVTLALALALVFGPAAALPAAAAQATATKPLYDRLGGLYPIASVVDAFIERLYVNDVLNANPAIRAARESVPKPGLKVHLTTMVCQATGGPCRYVGRSMKESHAHLNITQKEWTAMVADFRKTLDAFKVPAAEQEELVQIVESTRPDIVVGAKAVSQR
jgi:hemoglobin